MKLADKVVLITGGGGDMGKAIAVHCAAAGARCVLADISPAAIEATAAELTAGGADCRAVSLDVSNASACETAVNKVIDKMGKIDILVNNAGITRDKLLIQMTEDAWDAVISVNLKGTFNCTKAVLRGMMKHRFGRIVNVASIIGLMGNVGQANYAASKAGIIGLTKSVAKEVASRNITVNAIAPGFIVTAMTDKLSDEIKARMLSFIPLRRFGLPEEVAKLVLFLSSDDAGYITGQVIQIDGGMLM